MFEFDRDTLRRLYMQTCAGLIDQGRFIGDDPVGHCCCRPAVADHWQGGLAYRVCGQCLEWLRADNGRVTLPPWRAFAGRDGE